MDLLGVRDGESLGGCGTAHVSGANEQYVQNLASPTSRRTPVYGSSTDSTTASASANGCRGGVPVGKLLLSVHRCVHRREHVGP